MYVRKKYRLFSFSQTNTLQVRLIDIESPNGQVLMSGNSQSRFVKAPKVLKSLSHLWNIHDADYFIENISRMNLSSEKFPESKDPIQAHLEMLEGKSQNVDLILWAQLFDESRFARIRTKFVLLGEQNLYSKGRNFIQN